jgi:23S rRNA (uridine2552-2'-O)-methyltransferase
MSRSKRGRGWLQAHTSDAFVKQARQAGYRSRAAYKLLEIDQRDHLLHPGMTVVDLGAAPGGWSQVAAAKVGPKGRVIAIDLLDMPPIPGVTFIHGDFTESAMQQQISVMLDGGGADLVISDMAPNLTGRRDVDQANTERLNDLTLLFSTEMLRKGGNVLLKTFHGPGFDALRDMGRHYFDKVVVRKPKASRSHSSEVYLLALGFKQR